MAISSRINDRRVDRALRSVIPFEHPDRSSWHVVTATLPAGLTGQQQDVWTEVAAGRSTVREIAETLRLQPPHVYETLDQLAAAGCVFDLPAVCKQTSGVACPLCHRLPGIPCTTTDHGHGWHVARFGRACKTGVITGPELIAVLWTAGVFTPATVVEDGGA